MHRDPEIGGDAAPRRAARGTSSRAATTPSAQACARAATIASTAGSGMPPSLQQRRRRAAPAPSPSASFSSHGLRVAVAPGTPLLVNMGITRPPITATMNSTMSSASLQCRPTPASRSDAELRQVDGQRADRHQDQQADEEVVAPVARLDERNRQRDRRGQRKGRRWPAAAAQPKGVSTSTRPASHSAASAASGGAGRRRLVGPVSPGGEQEADDHGQGETEQHLVRVPQRPRQVGRRQPAGELQRPERRSRARRSCSPAGRTAGSPGPQRELAVRRRLRRLQSRCIDPGIRRPFWRHRRCVECARPAPRPPP